jgi:hypothetical protein
MQGFVTSGTSVQSFADREKGTKYDDIVDLLAKVACGLNGVLLGPIVIIGAHSIFAILILTTFASEKPEEQIAPRLAETVSIYILCERRNRQVLPPLLQNPASFSDTCRCKQRLV